MQNLMNLKCVHMKSELLNGSPHVGNDTFATFSQSGFAVRGPILHIVSRPFCAAC